MRYLVDAQLPPARALWLGAPGHDATHVYDLGMASASDREIWDHAALTDAVIVTKDEDFIKRRTFAKHGLSIIWVRRGNTTTRDLIAWWQPLFADILAALEREEAIVEIV